LTTETSETLSRKTSKDSPNVISSPESAGGRRRCDLRSGRQPDLFGRQAVPVRHSPTPAEKNAPLAALKGLTFSSETIHSLKSSAAESAAGETKGICGLSSIDSLESANLQRFLANRLKANLADCGSPEYKLTWKEWDIGRREPIVALRGWPRRISDSGCGGWPTPAVREKGGGDYQCPQKALKRLSSNHQINLSDMALLAGWATPALRDWRSDKGKKSDADQYGTKGKPLPRQAQLAGWDTPTAANANKEVARSAQGPMRHLAGWATPRVNKWGMPDSHGDNQKPFPARMKSHGVLNPAFSRWLMGYPSEWDRSSPNYQDWEMWQSIMHRLEELRETESTG